LKIVTDSVGSESGKSTAYIPEIKLIDPTTTLEDEAFPTPSGTSHRTPANKNKKKLPMAVHNETI
jgi:hypothetical protein